MKICNYEIKTTPLNPAEVGRGVPINNSIAFKIKGDFTFRVYCSIQYYLWSENRVPDVEEIASKLNVNSKEVEKGIESVNKQDKLVFYVKE